MSKKTISVELTLNQIETMTELAVNKITSLGKQLDAEEYLEYCLLQRKNSINWDYIKEKYEALGEEMYKYYVLDNEMANEQILEEVQHGIKLIEQAQEELRELTDLLRAKEHELTDDIGSPLWEAMFYGEEDK